MKKDAEKARQNRLQLAFYLNRLHLSWLSDEAFLKLMYRIRMGRKLHLDAPETFSEKLQYLKINDRNAAYSTMADKHAVKQFVADRIGKDVIIPTLGVWEHFDEIDFSALPEQFVLKCTHDSGSAVICKSKKDIDTAAVKRDFEARLKHNFYTYFREWAYKNVKPQIIAEQYMEEEPGQGLKDYKFFCFDGKPEFIQVDFDRSTSHKRNLYTPEWELLDWSYHYPTEKTGSIVKPEKLDEMLSIAAKLSQNTMFIRIDLYCIHHQIYFGECTFYPSAGYPVFSPDSVNKTVGDMLHLR